MCLIVYSDVLPRMIHDEVMATVEGKVGQQENELANALHRHIMADGRNCLETLHHENFMKKVQTSQVIVTPTANSSCRLDELNSIITEMATGDEAYKRLAELDSQSGLQTRATTKTRELGEPVTNAAPAQPMAALSDDDIAKNLVDQAAKLKINASALLAEAARLEKEASSMLPKAAAKSVPSITAKKKTINDTAKTKATKVKAG